MFLDFVTLLGSYMGIISSGYKLPMFRILLETILNITHNSIWNFEHCIWGGSKIGVMLSGLKTGFFYSA